MFEAYYKSFTFFKKYPNMIFLSLAVCIINSFFKGTGFSFIGAIFITILYTGGMVGLVYREKKDKKQEVNLKSLVIESGLNFSNIVLTFLETTIIIFINFVFAAFFLILPLMLLGYKENSAKVGYIMMLIIAIVVLIYRLPLLVMSYFPYIVTKENGKYAVMKIKEVIVTNPKIYIHLIFQFVIYFSITIYKYFFQKSLFLFSSLDVFAAMIYLLFIIVDFYLFLETVEKNNKLQKRFDRNYNGVYSNIIWRFFM